MLRRIGLLCIDGLTIAAAWFLAYWFRFNFHVPPPQISKTAMALFPMVFLFQGASYFALRLHRRDWRFTAIPDVLALLKSVLFATLLSAATVFFVNRLHHVPRTIFPLYGIFVFLAWVGARCTVRRFYSEQRVATAGKRLLIVGAGRAGEHLLRDLRQHAEYVPVGFVDDDRSKQKISLRGVPVLGRCRDVPELVREKKSILFFLRFRRPVLKPCAVWSAIANGRVFRTELFQAYGSCRGRVAFQALRKVELEDLLGRDPIELDWQHVHEQLQETVVLVTGGGGSIGSELCRQIAKQQPQRLVVLESSEANLFFSATRICSKISRSSFDRLSGRRGRSAFGATNFSKRTTTLRFSCGRLQTRSYARNPNTQRHAQQRSWYPHGSRRSGLCPC